jgi:hypothetical protein
MRAVFNYHWYHIHKTTDIVTSIMASDDDEPPNHGGAALWDQPLVEYDGQWGTKPFQNSMRHLLNSSEFRESRHSPGVLVNARNELILKFHPSCAPDILCIKCIGCRKLGPHSHH